MKNDNELIQDYLNQTLSDQELHQFMQRLETEADLRRQLRQYLALDAHLIESLNPQDDSFSSHEMSKSKMTPFSSSIIGRPFCSPLSYAVRSPCLLTFQ